MSKHIPEDKLMEFFDCNSAHGNDGIPYKLSWLLEAELKTFLDENAVEFKLQIMNGEVLYKRTKK